MNVAELKLELVKKLVALPEKDFIETYWLLTQLFWEQMEQQVQVPSESKTRPIGSMKGFLTYMADDFDAPLDDFRDYMPQ